MQSVHLSLRRFLVIIILSVSSVSQSFSQIEISNSIDFGYPVLINKYNQNAYYSQLAAGLRFGVSYKPTATQFYPTLDLAFGRTRLPLNQFEHNVVFMNYNYLNAMIKGNFVMNVFGENTLYLSLGIGADRLKQKGPGVSGENSGQMRVSVDSTANITKYLPAIGMGLEYVYGESVGRQIYLSVGLNAHVTLMIDERNTFYTTVVDAHGQDIALKGSLVGKAVTPDFHITLHYMLGKEVFFWKKKD